MMRTNRYTGISRMKKINCFALSSSDTIWHYSLNDAQNYGKPSHFSTGNTESPPSIHKTLSEGIYWSRKLFLTKYSLHDVTIWELYVQFMHFVQDYELSVRLSPCDFCTVLPHAPCTKEKGFGTYVSVYEYMFLKTISTWIDLGRTVC